MQVHNDDGDNKVLVIGGMVKLYCDFSATHDLTDLKVKEKRESLMN